MLSTLATRSGNAARITIPEINITVSVSNWATVSCPFRHVRRDINPTQQYKWWVEGLVGVSSCQSATPLTWHRME